MEKVVSSGTVIFHLFNKMTYMFLLIKQKHTNHWGFPKGHVEGDETLLETATRETFEEVGLKIDIYETVFSDVTYHVRVDAIKEVRYFLAKSNTQEVILQQDEILEARWLSYEEVLKQLTYDTDKHAFMILFKHANRQQIFIPIALMSYIDHHIIPQYQNLDPAHQKDHITKVMSHAFDLALAYDVNHAMIYVICAFHDIGMIHGRSDHHMTGAHMLNNDQMLKKWFSEKEISVMSQAVFDHRASLSDPPQTIYGKIIAQADRDLDLDEIIKRIIMYGKANYPNLPFDDFFKEGYAHLLKKYSANGYMKLFLKTPKIQHKIDELHEKINDQNYVFNKFLAMFQKN